MRLRVTVAFPDGVPPASETWHDAYSAIDMAIRWADMMVRLYPGSVVSYEQRCLRHGWEEHLTCVECSWPTCSEVAARSCATYDMTLCDDCYWLKQDGEAAA